VIASSARVTAGMLPHVEADQRCSERREAAQHVRETALGD